MAEEMMALAQEVSSDAHSSINLSSLKAAHLDIEVEEWKNLAAADIHLAIKIGQFLLESNKELEALLVATQAYAQDQQEKAMHLQKQVNALKKSYDEQEALYERFEQQLDELNTSYYAVTSECKQLQERNRNLWDTIDTLEGSCDEYLHEIEVLRNEMIVRDSTCRCKRRHMQRSRTFSISDIYDASVISGSEDSLKLLGCSNDKTVMDRSNDAENDMDKGAGLELMEAELVAMRRCSEDAFRKADVQAMEIASLRREIDALEMESAKLQHEKQALIRDLELLRAQFPTREECTRKHRPLNVNNDIAESQICSCHSFATENARTDFVNSNSSCDKHIVGFAGDYKLLFEELFKKLRIDRK